MGQNYREAELFWFSWEEVAMLDAKDDFIWSFERMFQQTRSVKVRKENATVMDPWKELCFPVSFSLSAVHLIANLAAV